MDSDPSSRPSSIGAPRLDVDAARHPPAGQVDDALEERDPHVRLDLLGHAQPVVEQVAKAVAAARARDDLEADAPLALVARVELDLPRLEVPVEGGEAEGPRRRVDHADGPVPGPRHAHEELVAGRHLALAAVQALEA